MKKTNLIKAMTMSFAFVALVIGFSSCHKKDKNNTDPSTNSGTTVVQDSISGNVHWTADKHYLLKGYVYVVKGSTITIDAGTIIKGDKATKGTLIIERGAKIMAQGTASNPIIFTSNQPVGQRSYGDWGGVILCGYSPNNWVASSHQDGTSGTLPPGIGQVEGGPRSLYGGTDPADNSGILSYARIEFGGVAFSPNNEINGLTLCSVGTGTQIDHIQVSYSGDDSYEWFGGTVNCKYLVAHRGWDDDFDTDNGFSGALQFGMIYRDPSAADQSGSHSFESDSRNENSTATPLTKAVFSNVTTVGPLTNPSFNGYNSNFVCGEIVRRSSSLSVFNSLFIGYPLGVIVDEDPSYGSTYANITGNTLKFKNNYVVGSPDLAHAIVARLNDPHSAPNSTAATSDSSSWTSNPSGPVQWFNANANGFGATEGLTSRLTNAFNGTNPNFVPTSTSGIVYNYNKWPIPGTTKTKQYPYNASKPINFDTTNQLANYNAPAMPYSFSDALLSGNAAITSVNYVGAFNSTGSISDNWTLGWTNFDPVNANYGDPY